MIRFNVVGGGSHNYTFRAVEQPFWNQTLPARSQGRVTAQLLGLSESGLKGPEIIRLMRFGAVDIGMGVFAFVAGDDATFEGVDLPGLPLAELVELRRTAALVGLRDMSADLLRTLKRAGFGDAKLWTDEEGGFAAGERYLPDGMPEPGFYRPVERGLELRIADKLRELKKLNNQKN